jgi:hypothetical protein
MNSKYTMNSEIFFTEKQRFNHWWLWVILLALNALFLSGIYVQVIAGKQFGDRPMSNTGLLITGALMILLTRFFTMIRLETQIKRDGIYVRFFPFHLSFRRYTWDKISSAVVRQYSPLRDYGGWGIRMGFAGKGSAFNVSGNQGLQLEFIDKKKLLIGTSKPAQLTDALEKLGKLKVQRPLSPNNTN